MFSLLNRLLVVFFAIFMVASAYFLYGSYLDVKVAHNKAKEIVDQQQTKHRLITNLYMAARERSLILLTMYTEDDIFELDELNQQMSAEASRFIEARLQLEDMYMSNEEKAIFDKQQRLVTINAPLQNKVSMLLMEGEREQAEILMFETAIPGQRKVLDEIALMLSLYAENAAKAIKNIDENYNKAARDFQILAVVFFIITSLFVSYMVLAIRRERQTLRKSAEEKAYQASHDPLTGLFNRWEFEHQIAGLIQMAKPDSSHYVVYLDLDQFKIVNDTSGHHVGDELLKQVPHIMMTCLREGDILARIGGDEFGIILENCNRDVAEKIADSLIQTINEFRFHWDHKTFKIGASIGMMKVSSNTQSLSEVLKHIDSACYAAKDSGRNRYHLYVESDQEMVQRKSEMDRIVQLENALTHDGFTLYAQPIMPVSNDCSDVNYELLLRLKTELGDPIPPGAFLPAAERFNKIGDIDRWVVKEALSILSDNPEFVRNVGYCSINLSGQSLGDSRFLGFIVDEFKNHQGLANKIVLEITETAAIINLIQANQFIMTLKELGVRFALDDFGSGLSSFEYLKTLPIDFLKIDGMFVKDIVTDLIDRAMVESIHDIGSLMGAITIAEFVENEAILNELKKIGVNYAQGYGISHPMPIDKAINDNPRNIKNVVA